MSFLSQTRSSETLLRGLGLVETADMSLHGDPSPEEMESELQRLEETFRDLMKFSWERILKHLSSKLFVHPTNVLKCFEHL